MREELLRCQIAPELILGDDSEYLYPEYFKKNLYLNIYSEEVDSYVEEELCGDYYELLINEFDLLAG